MSSAYKYSIVPLSIAALVLLKVGAARSEEEHYFSGGIMAEKCSRLIEGMNDLTAPSNDVVASMMLTWAEGYITGLNIELGDRKEPRFDMGSKTRIELWSAIYGFCKRNPDKPGAFAVVESTKLLTMSRD